MLSRSFSQHFAHVCRLLKASLWWPYFWHLKHLRGAGTFFKTLKAIPDFHFLGNLELNKFQDVGVVWIYSLPFLMVIPLIFVMPCYSVLKNHGLLPTTNRWSSFFLGGGVLPFYRGAVNVFYSQSVPDFKFIVHLSLLYEPQLHRSYSRNLNKFFLILLVVEYCNNKNFLLWLFSRRGLEFFELLW